MFPRKDFKFKRAFQKLAAFTQNLQKRHTFLRGFLAHSCGASLPSPAPLPIPNLRQILTVLSRVFLVLN
jgi:hypothetical protein